MEVIRQYVNNMFKNLPDTDEVNGLKSEILENMEEKYKELKTQGKSDNEAIGIIVTDFGNIDDLIKGLNLNTSQSAIINKPNDYNETSDAKESYNEPKYTASDYGKAGYSEQKYTAPDYGKADYSEQKYTAPDYGKAGYSEQKYTAPDYGKANYSDIKYTEPNYDRKYNDVVDYKKSKAFYKLPEVSLEDAEAYISAKTDMSYFTASGVGIILIGVAIFLILVDWFDMPIISNILSGSVAESMPVVILLIMIAIAVGLFIYAGNHLEQFKYIEDNKFFIYKSVCDQINQEYISTKSTMDMRTIVGIVLCIISPIGVFLSELYGVSILLVIIAIGVFLIVHSSNVTSAYKKILFSKNIDEG